MLIIFQGVLIMSLLKSSMETDEELKELNKALLVNTKAGGEALQQTKDLNTRLQNVEAWQNLAVVWMKHYQKKLYNICADIAQIKNVSVYTGSDDPDVPVPEKSDGAGE